MAEVLFFSAVSSLIFFILGGIIGWMGNDIVYATTAQQPEYTHPEMYDSNGTPYSGDLLSLRFEERQVEDED
tara:strand:+ start:2157 stop:2372 length:216 start_codon:yes stop_codon:yes gene_type:complete